MKRILFAAVWLLFATSATLFAVRTPATRPIPNYDKRLAAQPATAEIDPGKKAAAERLQELVPGVDLQIDRIRHSPNFISSPQGFLSGPKGNGKGISEAASRAIRADDPHHSVKAFLQEHSALFGHGPEALN